MFCLLFSFPLLCSLLLLSLLFLFVYLCLLLFSLPLPLFLLLASSFFFSSSFALFVCLFLPPSYPLYTLPLYSLTNTLPFFSPNICSLITPFLLPCTGLSFFLFFSFSLSLPTDEQMFVFCDCLFCSSRYPLTALLLLLSVGSLFLSLDLDSLCLTSILPHLLFLVNTFLQLFSSLLLAVSFTLSPSFFLFCWSLSVLLSYSFSLLLPPFFYCPWLLFLVTPRPLSSLEPIEQMFVFYHSKRLNKKFSKTKLSCLLVSLC